jgi:putative membrane protein
MLRSLAPLLIHWGIISLSLWVASRIFRGIRFADTQSLVISALLLGFVNAIVRPLLIVLTLPLTVVTLGLLLLVINALMLLLVSWMVRGFTVSGFWTAFFASIFIALLSFMLGSFLENEDTPVQYRSQSRWVEIHHLPATIDTAYAPRPANWRALS